MNWENQKKSQLPISLQAMDFQRDIHCRMFLRYLWKGRSQNKGKVFQNTMNFEDQESSFEINRFSKGLGFISGSSLLRAVYTTCRKMYRPAEKWYSTHNFCREILVLSMDPKQHWYFVKKVTGTVLFNVSVPIFAYPVNGPLGLCFKDRLLNS